MRAAASMIEPAAGAAVAPVPGAATAGRLLREARERQGLHIAALAASIKVTQKKLEALEGDRFDELPDATFTRALAQTVCRALKIDGAEIMKLLPPPAGHRLEQVGEGLNAPFRARPGALVQRGEWTSALRSPAFWLTALVLLAALALYFLPGRLLGLAPPGSAAAKLVAAAAPSAVVAAPPPRAEVPGMPPDTKPEEGAPVAAPVDVVVANGSTGDDRIAASSAAPSVVVAVAPAASATGSAASMMRVQASAASWVEISDARGVSLIARLVKAGEAVDVDGAPPFKVRIGNAAGTRLAYRGQPVELAAATRDNIARLELK